jgi:hypothetical protein
MSSGVCVKFFATLLLLWTVLNRLQNVHEEWDIRQKDAIFTLDSISWHRNRCLEDSLELKNEASLWEEEGLSLSSIWRLSFNFEALFHRGSKSVEIFAKKCRAETAYNGWPEDFFPFLSPTFKL